MKPKNKKKCGDCKYFIPEGKGEGRCEQFTQFVARENNNQCGYAKPKIDYLSR